MVSTLARRSPAAATFIALLLLCIPAFAVEPDERLADPVLEARARHISAELRCLVCQNQSIDDSSAPLARDLRLLVRERLAAGSSDAEVIRFLVDRYGDFVLLRPRFNLQTAILWLAPFLLLGGVLVVLWRSHRNRVGAARVADPARPLTPDEQQRLDRILSGDADR